MKKNQIRAKCFYVTCSLALTLAACNPTDANIISIPTLSPSQTQPTETITPTIEATLPPMVRLTPTFFSSAPQDDSLDYACRETINFFFSYKQGDDLQVYRDLFTPSSQYLADSFRPPAEALILLELMPASQEWQRDSPGRSLPITMLPEGPNEYTYYVRFTGHYGSNGTPVYTNIFPDSWTMFMISDGPYSCKIKGYGKG